MWNTIGLQTPNMNDVKGIEYKSGFVYRVIFDDGNSGEVGFSEYPGRGPVFKPLQDISFFRQAQIEGGTISWPNGTGIAPEALYKKYVNNSIYLQALA